MIPPERKTKPFGRYRVTTRGGMPLSFSIPHDLRSSREARACFQSIAGQDALTGLTNSHVFAVLAGQEIRRSQRHHRPLALITIQFEDPEEAGGFAAPGRFGRILRAAAAAIFSKLRQPDLMARLGDSTLVILLPETGCLEACALAGTLRAALSPLCAALSAEPGAELPTPLPGLGVAALGENTRCLEDLLKQSTPAYN
jgi:diguanylate cyclase (GGDEF)-like protein